MKLLDIKTVAQLMRVGKSNGFVTQDDIFNLFPEPEKHIDKLDDLYEKLIKLKVDIVENLAIDRAKKLFGAEHANCASKAVQT